MTPFGLLIMEVHADLADGRPVAAALNLAADEVVDFPLPWGECIQVSHGFLLCRRTTRTWMTHASMGCMHDTGDQ